MEPGIAQTRRRSDSLRECNDKPTAPDSMSSSARPSWPSRKTPHTMERSAHARSRTQTLARLLIADVTLLKGADVRAQVRFNGGATHTLRVSRAKLNWMQRQTPAAIVAEVDRLLENYTAERSPTSSIAAGAAPARADPSTPSW